MTGARPTPLDQLTTRAQPAIERTGEVQYWAPTFRVPGGGGP